MKNPSLDPSLVSMEEGAHCEKGGCLPSHRVARQVSTVMIAMLLLALIVCGVYLWWSQSQ